MLLLPPQLISVSLGVMPFPASSHGRISVYGADVTRAITGVEAVIRSAELRSISTGAGRIEFVADPQFGLSESSTLRAVDAGTVAFREADGWLEVRYRISFIQMLRYSVVLIVPLFAVAAFVLGIRLHEVPFLLFLAGTVWLVLFGLSYVTTASRFRAAVRDAVERARPTRNV